MIVGLFFFTPIRTKALNAYRITSQNIIGKQMFFTS